MNRRGLLSGAALVAAWALPGCKVAPEGAVKLPALMPELYRETPVLVPARK